MISESDSERALIRSLLRTFGRQASGRPAPAELDSAFSASPAAWRKALSVLDYNRVTGMVGASAIAEGSIDSFPAESAAYLREVSEAAFARNVRRLEVFFKTLHVLRAEGAEPALLKSAGMAARFPKILAHNQMSDCDLYIPKERLPAMEAVLVRAGMIKNEITRDAVYYLDEPSGLLLDIHHRFRLFEHLDYDTITREVPVSLPSGETALVLTREAELTHLIYHLNGHRKPHGYKLRWLMDILALLLEEGGQLDAGKLATTNPDDKGDFWVARLLGFFAQEFDVDLRCAALPPVATPFSLKEVLTSQRHASFRLNEFRGWKTMIATMLGMREIDQRTYPAPFDFRADAAYARDEEEAKRVFQESL